jgi:hypothetical protein
MGPVIGFPQPMIGEGEGLFPGMRAQAKKAVTVARARRDLHGPDGGPVLRKVNCNKPVVSLSAHCQEAGIGHADQ